MVTIEAQIEQIESQIKALKAERDRRIKEADLDRARLNRILGMRSPQRTICQILRELHASTEGEDREKVEQCLLIAKKMDEKLAEYAGQGYARDWYD